MEISKLNGQFKWVIKSIETCCHLISVIIEYLIHFFSIDYNVHASIFPESQAWLNIPGCSLSVIVGTHVSKWLQNNPLTKRSNIRKCSQFIVVLLKKSLFVTDSGLAQKYLSSKQWISWSVNSDSDVKPLNKERS